MSLHYLHKKLKNIKAVKGLATILRPTSRDISYLAKEEVIESGSLTRFIAQTHSRILRFLSESTI